MVMLPLAPSAALLNNSAKYDSFNEPTTTPANEPSGLDIRRLSAMTGVLSERDLVRAMAGHGGNTPSLRVEQVYTRESVTCMPETDVHGAIAVMHEKRFRHLPVVRDGRLTGVVSLNDLVIHLLREAEQVSQQFVL